MMFNTLSVIAEHKMNEFSALLCENGMRETERLTRGDLLVEKKVYTMDNMVEQPFDTAPSLDLPALRIEKFYMPKDGEKMMLFFCEC